MLLKDITLATPQENILYDNVLMKLAEHGEGEEALRFWESEELFIVLGRIGNPAADLRIEKVLADRVPVLRRSSGGGRSCREKGALITRWFYPRSARRSRICAGRTNLSSGTSSPRLKTWASMPHAARCPTSP